MGYTAKRGTDLIAFGTSGISELDGAHAQDHRRLADYLAGASTGELPIERGLVPTPDDLIRRRVISELMCNGRVDLAAIGSLFGVDSESYFRRELDQIAGLGEEGLVTTEGLVVDATELGRLFVRRLAMVFDAHLHRNRSGFSSTI